MRITKRQFVSRFLMVVLLATVTGVAQAQRGQFSPEQMKERLTTQAKEVAEQLELSEEQMPKYMEIVIAGVEKQMELRASMQGGGGFQGIREKMQKINEETMTALAEVLTDEQMEKYQEIRAERQQRRRRRQG